MISNKKFEKKILNILNQIIMQHDIIKTQSINTDTHVDICTNTDEFVAKKQCLTNRIIMFICYCQLVFYFLFFIVFIMVLS